MVERRNTLRTRARTQRMRRTKRSDSNRAQKRGAGRGSQFKNTLANVGLDLAYLDQPDFIRFWNEDAARIETAVRQIGRVQN
jgi:hypothetical protein